MTFTETEMCAYRCNAETRTGRERISKYDGGKEKKKTEQRPSARVVVGRPRSGKERKERPSKNQSNHTLQQLNFNLPSLLLGQTQREAHLSVVVIGGIS